MVDIEEPSFSLGAESSQLLRADMDIRVRNYRRKK